MNHCFLLLAAVAGLLTVAVDGKPVSMLISANEELVAVSTIQQGVPPGTGDPAVLRVGAGDPAQHLLDLPPLPKVESEPYKDPTPPAAAKTAPAAFVEDPIPEGALYPDSTGAIVLVNKLRRDANGRPAQVISARNPWGVRVVTKDTLLTFTITLDGIIIGSDRERATALINSLPVRKGQTQTGPFTLAGIRRHEVIMAYDGTYFVVPESRQISVRIPKS